MGKYGSAVGSLEAPPYALRPYAFVGTYADGAVVSRADEGGHGVARLLVHLQHRLRFFIYFIVHPTNTQGFRLADATK